MTVNYFILHGFSMVKTESVASALELQSAKVSNLKQQSIKIYRYVDFKSCHGNLDVALD